MSEIMKDVNGQGIEIPVALLPDLGQLGLLDGDLEGTMNDVFEGFEVRKPPVPPEIYIMPVLHCLCKSISTVGPPLIDVPPGSRGSGLVNHAIFVIFLFQNSNPKVYGLVHNSPGQAHQDRLIFYSSFLNPQPPFSFRKNDSIPRDYIYYFLIIGGSPNEVSLDSFNDL